MGNNNIGISIIVATFNDNDSLIELLHSISVAYSTLINKTLNKLKVEIIISDNSTKKPKNKELINLCKKYLLKLRYLNVKPLGTAYARNYAIKKARYGYIAIIDSDCIMDSKWFVECIKTLKKEPDIIQGAYYIPYKNGWFSLSESKWDKVRWIERQADTRNFLIKKKAYLKIGGFDIKHFYSAGAEDLTLIPRANKAGLRIVFEKKVKVYHKYPENLFYELKRYLYYGKASIHLKTYSKSLYAEFSYLALWKNFLGRIIHLKYKEAIYQFLKISFFTIGYLIGKKHYYLEEKINKIISPHS